MFWTLLALSLMVILGGFLAYMGDLLGRRMGKRRITIGNLRPKHTAILITSLTGVIVSAITTATLFLAVAPVRTVILNGEAAIREYKSTAKALREKQSELATLSNKYTVAQAREEAAQKSAVEAKTAAGVFQSKAAELKTDLAKRQSEYRLVSARLETSRSELNRANQELEIVRATSKRLSKDIAQYENANEYLARANEDLTRTKGDLQKQVAGLNKDRETAEKSLQKVTGELASSRQEYTKLQERTQTLLAQSTNEFVNENIRLSKRCDTLTDEVTDLKSEVGRLNDVLKGHVSITQQIAKDLDMARTRRIVLHKGEDLARAIIPANCPPSEVRKRVVELMNEANLTALNKGATIGQGVRAVELDLTNQPMPEGSPTFAVAEDARIDALVRVLEYSRNAVCLIMEVAQNSPEKQPAKVEFRPYENKLVYAKGSKLASKRIDAALPSPQIFDEIVELIKEAGRMGLTGGMIPRVDGIGDPQVGTLSASEIAALVEEVRSVGRAARITAWTTKDTYSGDALDLRFRVNAGP